MIKKIFFTKNIGDLTFNDLIGDTIVVNHPHYKDLPTVVSGAKYLSLNEFKSCYMSIHFVNLVIIGLNKIITPSNRCDMFNDFLQTMTRSKNKISVDTKPFIGEPWRAWYHFDVVNENKWDVPHGFAIETEWKKWFYRDVVDCRFSSNGIHTYKGNCIYSDLRELSHEISYSVIDKEKLKWYENMKENVIRKFNTPKRMINEILKNCNNEFGLSYNMNSYLKNKEICLPDLNIYHFVAEENLRRIKIYNELVQ